MITITPTEVPYTVYIIKLGLIFIYRLFINQRKKLNDVNRHGIRILKPSLVTYKANESTYNILL
jgi:hypothetical protein